MPEIAKIHLLTTIDVFQTFAQQPSEQEVNPGVDVVMACRVANKAPQSECIWQKGGGNRLDLETSSLFFYQTDVLPSLVTHVFQS